MPNFDNLLALYIFRITKANASGFNWFTSSSETFLNELHEGS